MERYLCERTLHATTLQATTLKSAAPLWALFGRSWNIPRAVK